MGPEGTSEGPTKLFLGLDVHKYMPFVKTHWAVHLRCIHLPICGFQLKAFLKSIFLSKKISLKNQVCVTNLIFWLIYLYAILHPKIQYLHQDPHLLIFNFFPKSLLFYLWILLPLFSSFHGLCWEHQQMTPTFLQTKSVCMILSVSLITTLMMFISIFFSCF